MGVGLEATVGVATRAGLAGVDTGVLATPLVGELMVALVDAVLEAVAPVILALLATGMSNF